MKKINVMTIVNNVDSLFPFKKLLDHTMAASAFITFTLIRMMDLITKRAIGCSLPSGAMQFGSHGEHTSYLSNS